MSQEKSEALVLRGVDFSESSRIVTFLTPARGRLACIAKGARRKNSRLGPILDSLNRVEIVYYYKEGRQVQNLAEASLLDGFVALKGDLERNAYAALPLEIAYKAVHENEPSESFYARLVGGMADLGLWPGHAGWHVAWQVLHLLAEAGFAPQLDECVSCGRVLGKDAVGFDWSAGAVCARCAPRQRIAAGTFSALCALRAATEGCPVQDGKGGDSERVSETVVREVIDVLSAYAARQLDSDLRSTRVLRQLFG